jgi:hypothetical protein
VRQNHGATAKEYCPSLSAVARHFGIYHRSKNRFAICNGHDDRKRRQVRLRYHSRGEQRRMNAAVADERRDLPPR